MVRGIEGESSVLEAKAVDIFTKVVVTKTHGI
jgi:hypothetical protein